MWLFCPVMNSSARNDRMAILRNSFNSASLRANVFFFLVAFKRTDDVLNGRQLLLIITYFFYRYTSLVDRYVPNIAACLKDGTSLVRRQTLTLLTHLLQVSKSTRLSSAVNHWPRSYQRRFIFILCKNDHTPFIVVITLDKFLNLQGSSIT